MTDQARFERLLRLIQMMSGPRFYTVAELCRELGTSRRTIYRYLETFKDAGFVVEKNDSGIYRIAMMSSKCSNLENLVYFSKEEAKIVGSLIEHLDQTNSLKAGLHRKLASIYSTTSLKKFVGNKNNAANVDSLSKAIEYRKKVILKNYQSGSSLITKDRFVEPFAFTTNFLDVWAYDLNDGMNKVFKITRIEDVEILNEPWSEEDKHHEKPVDVFRMSGEPLERIVLRMTSLAKNLLLEEFPLAENHIRQEGNDWILETEISEVYGAGRFVMGLPADVELLQGDILSGYIAQMLASFMAPQYLDIPAPEDNCQGTKQ